MELNKPIANEPITLEGQLRFCVEGNRLAVEYLTAARDALRKSEGWTNETAIKMKVVEPLERLLGHAKRCPTCS